jgi:hypothetical protein
VRNKDPGAVVGLGAEQRGALLLLARQPHQKSPAGAGQVRLAGTGPSSADPERSEPVRRRLLGLDDVEL